MEPRFSVEVVAVGTVYELVRSSSGYTRSILNNFTGGTDGANPLHVESGFSRRPLWNNMIGRKRGFERCFRIEVHEWDMEPDGALQFCWQQRRLAECISPLQLQRYRSGSSNRVPLPAVETYSASRRPPVARP